MNRPLVCLLLAVLPLLPARAQSLVSGSKVDLQIGQMNRWFQWDAEEATVVAVKSPPTGAFVLTRVAGPEGPINWRALRESSAAPILAGDRVVIAPTGTSVWLKADATESLLPQGVSPSDRSAVFSISRASGSSDPLAPIKYGDTVLLKGADAESYLAAENGASSVTLSDATHSTAFRLGDPLHTTADATALEPEPQAAQEQQAQPDQQMEPEPQTELGPQTELEQRAEPDPQTEPEPQTEPPQVPQASMH